MRSNSFAWPRCFRCQKPAHRVDVEEGPDFRSKVYTVYCHGEVEIATLDYDMLIRGEVVILGLGEVFRPNLLENPDA